MKTKSLMLGAAATLSLAALALAPANAETSGTNHAAAVEACSAIARFSRPKRLAPSMTVAASASASFG